MMALNVPQIVFMDSWESFHVLARVEKHTIPSEFGIFYVFMLFKGNSDIPCAKCVLNYDLDIGKFDLDNFDDKWEWF